jgi:uncharacterized OB-fold protein
MTDLLTKEPEPTLESQVFWDAAKEEQFLVKTCKSCGKAHWYPRDHCPLCGSLDTEWVEASGEGVIYSYCIMRRADPVYTMAYVTLKEGPTMMTNIVDCNSEELKIGDAVKVVFKPTENGFKLPMFTPG